MHHQVLALKYRPSTFAEIVDQQPTVQALTNALNHYDRYPHHAYLFTGTRGVGKTTLARILAKCLNCEVGISAIPCEECHHCQEINQGRFPDFYEIDAASRTKVEDTRELLENVMYAPSQGRFKVYLIDEVHMLSGSSFNALLKTLEEPPPHVKFLLATTEYHKLPATVLSRCLQFHLRHITPHSISQHLAEILSKEQIAHDVDALNLLAKAAEGSMRDALSLLDQCIAFGNGEIKTDQVKVMLGTVETAPLNDLLQAVYHRDGDQLMTIVQQLADHGTNFPQALADVLSLLHRIAVKQLVPRATLDDGEQLATLATQFSKEDIQLLYQIGLNGQRDLAYAPSPQSGFEMVLLRMMAFYPEGCDQSRIQRPPVQTTNLPNSPSSNTPDSTAAMQWHDILPHLQLTGAALALASQCSLVSLTQEECRLVVSARQKPLLQEQPIERIRRALHSYYQHELYLSITIADHQQPTPAAIKAQQRQLAMNEAKQTITSDTTVQQIIENFDATIVEDSITIK